LPVLRAGKLRDAAQSAGGIDWFPLSSSVPPVTAYVNAALRRVPLSEEILQGAVKA
jgi:hypothetical protein